jgi:hypothetical protein
MKALIQTKTFKVACLQAAVAIIIIFNGAYPEAGWLLIVKSLVDSYLRMITETPVAGILKK